MNRRIFLGNSAATLAALGLPIGAALAAVGQTDRKLIVVFVQGGWDPTRLFADGFDHSGVAMEAEAERSNAGDIPYVAHTDRPSVSAFMAAHHDRMLVFNGVMVRSIAHEICTTIALTGDTSGLLSDWPAIIGHVQSDRFTLPHLVVGGPNFAGDIGTSVARAGNNGQLEGLLSGKILDAADGASRVLPMPARGIIDRYLARRSEARVLTATPGMDENLASAFDEALQRATELQDYRYVMDFTATSDLATQAQVGVDALALGLSRCVTMGHAGGGINGWDTHSQNDDQQGPMWENLFAGLNQLMALLHDTPGTSAPSLAEETTVVVMSEMGRTPALNSNLGKDHWPFTSVMVVGDGLTGNRVVGGFDEGWMGLTVDFGSGEATESGRLLSIEAIGATLLQHMGIDPSEHVAGTPAIEGVLL
jgi:hypothetical protein